MKTLKTNDGYKVYVRDNCHKKILSLKRKYSCVGYALYWRVKTYGDRDGEIEFQGWGRTVYTCKGMRV